MIPAPALRAFTDRRLVRRDLIAYGVALEELTFLEYRPLKVRVLARQTGMHYPDACRALRALVAHGYLLRGANDGAGRMYALASTVREPRAA